LIIAPLITPQRNAWELAFEERKYLDNSLLQPNVVKP